MSADPARRVFTGVVRIAAGTRLPGRRHIRAEQRYMLSGEAQVADSALEAGDYYRATASTSPNATHTRHGCEFLLISSAVEMLG